MREIEFRAKVKGDAEIYKVWAIDWLNLKIMLDGSRTNEWIDMAKIQALMQNTGFKDKNGLEIFEGDILLYKKLITKTGYFDEKKVRFVKQIRRNPKEEYHYWEVKYFPEKGSWRVKRGNAFEPLYAKCDNHEIAGNIYQNKELLDDKNS